MCGFDNNKYLKIQSEHIKERILKFNNKLYLEFGGKLFDDFHASRVLPGFLPDSKIKMLSELSNNAEVIIAINANDIVNNKIRADYGITYKEDVLRLIDAFKSRNFNKFSVVITMYSSQFAADKFKLKLEKLGINVYLHYPISGYPSNVDLIVSEDGYGKNEYVKTSKSLVIVTAPGPGSGKMATCLSQLYHEIKRGTKAGYAKFETFPIWNLPLDHPVNLAYEAATADLNDINMIDPFHLEKYNLKAVNYNRDVENFPVLKAILEKILGSCPYASPTDMGVNMAGNCITDDEKCKYASNQEIIRRYLKAKYENFIGKCDENIIYKIELIMNKAKISTKDRKTVEAALIREVKEHNPAVAIELSDKTIITGGTTDLMGASCAALLNALKYLANIKKETILIAPEVIKPIQKLKTNGFKNSNPRLHLNEVLIALSISSIKNQSASLALASLNKLKNCQAHSSVALSSVDIDIFNKLGINLTVEPKYQNENFYHKS